MNSKIIKAVKMVGVYIAWVGPDERLFFVSISSSIVRMNHQKWILLFIFSSLWIHISLELQAFIQWVKILLK